MSITDVEARIAGYVARGEWVDLREQPDIGQSVSGEFIRRLLTATPLPQSDHEAIVERQPAYAAFRPSADFAPVPISAAGVRIRGALVHGPIELSDCTGEGGSSLPALALEECRLLGSVGIDERDLQDDKAMTSLDLSRASITSVSLKASAFTYLAMFNARVDGPVEISGAGPLAGWEDRDIDAGRMPTFRRTMLAAAGSRRGDHASGTVADFPSMATTTDRTDGDEPASMHPHRYCWLDLSGSRLQGSLVAQKVRLRVPRRDREGRSDVQRPARFALRLEAATVAGKLDARGGSVFDGGLSLYLADIRDEVWLGGGFLLKEDGIALDAQGARLGGLFGVAPPVRVRGTVFLNSARISGHVKLPAADIDGDGNSSLMAESSTIAGDLVLNKCAIRGPVGLSGATIGGMLDLSGAMLSGATRGDQEGDAGERCDALHARNLSVGSDAFLSDGFIADGCVWLSGARMGDNLDLRGATLTGTIPKRYHSANVVRDHQFSAPDETVSALSASDIAVGGSLWLGSARRDSQMFLAQGHVNLQRASIGKDLEIINARILPPSSPAAMDRQVLDLGWVTVAGTLILDSNQFAGVVNFEHASTNVLADADKNAYQGASHLRLNGFKYETFYEPPGDREPSSVSDLVKTRTDWLKQMPSYRPQPYAHLAQVLSSHGRTDEARDILIEKYSRERQARVRRVNAKLLRTHFGEFVRTFVLSAASWLLGLTFGYGLKPGRAFKTLLVAFLFGWAFFATANYRGAMVVDQQPIAGYVQDDRMVALKAGDNGASGVRCSGDISPALYALDVFIPLVDLRQESKCEMGPAKDAVLFDGFPIGGRMVLNEIAIDQYLKAFYALAGWLLISLSILTFSGVLQRRDTEG